MIPQRVRFTQIALGFFCLLLFGCKSNKSDQTAIHEQTPEQTVEKIMASYDSNKDGALDAPELEKCPSLKTLLKSMNKGPGGKITQDELLQKIKDMQSSAIKMPAVPCVVTLDGAPLSDATVTFTLEAFHGASAEATGKSDPDGRAEVKSGEGVLSGFYRVSVSKQVNGAEAIPARFNSATIIGIEVSAQGLGRGGTLPLDLSSR
jgi:hypothetical protein